VIPIHDYGEIDGRLYVNMRLIEGRDLQEMLADGPMDPARAVRIIEQVAKALHAAHKKLRVRLRPRGLQSRVQQSAFHAAQASTANWRTIPTRARKFSSCGSYRHRTVGCHSFGRGRSSH
jgi:serine/threonine protein kinase